jgi:hypothetical protein
MAQSDVQTIINPLVREENTAELAKYWAKKYEYIFEQNYAKLTENTEEIITQKSIATYIPSAKINIQNHLKNDKTINEDLLINTIEVMIRLLDSIVSFLAEQGFDDVLQYRNISLELDGVEQFQAMEGDVEYLAGLIGETAYRASEFIADEKGLFEGYKDVKNTIRKNTFDSWLQVDGSIRSVDFNEKEIEKLKVNHDLTLVQRRNYNLLNFKNIVSMQQWSDEYEEVESNTDRQVEIPAPETPNPNPFQITIQEQEVKQKEEPKKQVNRHIDQIFQHLLQEQEGNKTVEKAVQIRPPEPQKIEEKPGYGVRLFVVIDHRGKYIFFKDQDKLSLPYIEISTDRNLTQKLKDGLLKKYNLLVNIEKEFGVHFDRRQGQYVNIGYVASLENHTLPADLFWTAPGDGNFLTDNSMNLVLKYQEVQGVGLKQNDDGKVASITDRQENKPESQNAQPIRTPKIEPKEIPARERQPAQPNQTFTPNNFKKSAASKVTYGLRLNQKIQTKTFGNVEIEFEYSKDCPQIVEYSCQILEARDKHALDVIIALINLLMLQNYDLDTIENYLETRVKTDENNTINNFITVIVYAFRETPNNLKELMELLG